MKEALKHRMPQIGEHSLFSRQNIGVSSVGYDFRSRGRRDAMRGEELGTRETREFSILMGREGEKTAFT